MSHAHDQRPGTGPPKWTVAIINLNLTVGKPSSACWLSFQVLDNVEFLTAMLSSKKTQASATQSLAVKSQ